jgi:hypothetical protein
VGKEIKDLKDLEVGNKYKLVARVSTAYSAPGSKHIALYQGIVSHFECYRFISIDSTSIIDIKANKFVEWDIEDITEDEPKDEPKDKVPAPAIEIEMLIKGIDDLILKMENPNTPTILELSLREILLAGGEITIRQSKDL